MVTDVMKLHSDHLH